MTGKKKGKKKKEGKKVVPRYARNNANKETVYKLLGL